MTCNCPPLDLPAHTSVPGERLPEIPNGHQSDCDQWVALELAEEK